MSCHLCENNTSILLRMICAIETAAAFQRGYYSSDQLLATLPFCLTRMLCEKVPLCSVCTLDLCVFVMGLSSTAVGSSDLEDGGTVRQRRGRSWWRCSRAGRWRLVRRGRSTDWSAHWSGTQKEELYTANYTLDDINQLQMAYISNYEIKTHHTQ